MLQRIQQVFAQHAGPAFGESLVPVLPAGDQFDECLFPCPQHGRGVLSLPVEHIQVAHWLSLKVHVVLPD